MGKNKDFYENKRKKALGFFVTEGQFNINIRDSSGKQIRS